MNHTINGWDIMLINEVLKKGRPISKQDISKITEFYTPYVKRVTGMTIKKLPNMIDFEDALQYAYLGFLQCVKRYEPKPGVPFKYYAFLRIKYSIIDSLRRFDHVTRYTRRQLKSIDRAAKEYEGVSEDYKLDAYSKYLGMSKEQITKAQVLNYISRSKSLEAHQELFGDNDIIAEKSEDSTVQFNKVFKDEISKILEEKIGVLTPKEEFVIRMIYFSGLSALDVSVHLKFSDSRVSQLHNQALKKLRFMLRGYKNLDKTIK
jgi:RNA polymerase sigma factor for flagellar operon FliA